MPNYINEVSREFFNLIGKSDMITIDGGVMLDASSCLEEVTGNPDNDVMGFSWHDEDGEYSEEFTEGNIANGRFSSDGVFICENQDGETSVFNFFTVKPLLRETQDEESGVSRGSKMRL
jgi:hypothetical protein